MPSEKLKKAVKDGLITQKQYDKLPEKMLEGLVKKGGNAGMRKHRARPTKGGAGGRKNVGNRKGKK
tara:strand:- start:5515 stop:5712 length:198 start_codon:yes stop_codon:yes gene_type:complete